jgi:hypothetical protein
MKLLKGFMIVINQILGFGKCTPKDIRIPNKVPIESKLQKITLSLKSLFLIIGGSSYNVMNIEITRIARLPSIVKFLLFLL